ncbi:3-oxoacyl-ACP reductase FabG [Petroclostridium sp. X23]|uniref:SDR family NAD(P)-dependent oxidoreductase n=1 Tax=Petroclostridium sp. X23 TaxID=3045146 RepID=UPI0024ACDFA5|nr:3-oxoacyl-ACP reductase FabG [Petroclostridium sp. X23]WHH57786.1 3-oxoacyl-ACP reductase FabG [Petroclostridium sp. X23]
MDTGLKNKVAVITGGTSGIGASMALEYAKEGVKVVVCGRNKDKLEGFINSAKEQGYEIDGKICDVSNEQAVKKFADDVAESYGGIDIWINNAGIVKLCSLMKLKMEDWKAILQTNLTAVFVSSRIAAEYMIKRGGGNIVNISSFTALIASANNGAYSVSKAGVITLTKVLAAELAPYNIRVNAIIPGYIRTDMGNIDIDTKAEQIIKPISLKRFGTPQDIAAGAIFLTSDCASYITGEALVISGGKFIVQNAMDPWSWER